MDIGSVVAHFKADVSNFQAGIATSQNALGRFTADLKQRSADGMRAFMAASAAIGVSAAVLGKKIFDTGVNFEQFRISFTTMLGSADRANALLNQLTDFARKTPFNLPDVVEGSKRLLAYGIEAEKIIPTMRMLGDITAGVGRDKLPQLILAYGQVQTATRLTGMELRQFTEAGVPLLDEIAKVTGKSAAEIKDGMENGMAVPAELVTQALYNMTTKGGRFFNLMALQSKSLGGQITNLQDAFTTTFSGVGEALATKIAPFVGALAEWIVNNRTIVVSLTAAGLAVALFTTVVSGAVFIIGTMVTILGGPLTLILTLIAALIGVKVFNATKNLMQGFKSIGEGAKMAEKSVTSSTGQMAGPSAKDMAKAGKAARDLAKDLAKIDEQAAKSERSFKESLAEMIRNAQKKVTDLTKSIQEENDNYDAASKERVADFERSNQEENANFAEANDERKTKFDEAQKELVQSHEEKVKDIEEQIDEEVAKGNDANETTLKKLRERLAAENADFEEAQAKKIADYEAETQKAAEEHEKKTKKAAEENERQTQKAKEEHDKKLADLQLELDAENAKLQKHSEDVIAIKDVQLLDEIDLLKRSHAEQMAEYQKQKDEAIATAREQSAGQSGAFAATGAAAANMQQQTQSAMEGITNSMSGVSDALEGIGRSFSRVSSFVRDFIGLFTDFRGTTQRLAGELRSLTDSMDTATRQEWWKSLNFGEKVVSWLSGARPRAGGGPVKAGDPYVVGEEGTELFIPSTSGRIIPHGQTAAASALGGANITISLAGATILGTQGGAQELAEVIGDNLLRVIKRNTRV